MKSFVASHLKDMNRQLVFSLIAELKTTSKAEISKKTNISTPTTIKIVHHLLETGLVLELGEGESSVGRKPQLLSLNQDLLYAASFFFEGEFLTFGIVDICGQVVYKKSLRCEPRFDLIMTRIADGLVATLFQEADISLEKLIGIGIAIPGIYDPQAQMLLSAPLIGIHAPTDISSHIAALQARYGVAVMVENDTNAQSLGEFQASGMESHGDMMLLSIGTGLGAGLILGGKLRRGINHMGGEIGYFAFSDDAIAAKGNPGWLEKKICYRELEDRFGIDVGTDLSALPPKMVELMLDYVSKPLSLCINNIVMLLDLNAVRIGGIVVDMLGDRLIGAINEKLEHLCISDIRVAKQTSEDIGLIGLASSLMQAKIREILAGDIA